MTARYSAIIPNYNDGSKIRESLDSLVKQELPFCEMIIVDDGSTDNSVEIIKELLKDLPQARLVQHEKNRGVVGAINTGIAEAIGEYIFLCSANDIYYPRMTARCEEMLQRYPQASIVSGNVAAYDQKRERFTYDMKLPLPQVLAYLSPEDLVAYNRKSALHPNGGANALRLDKVRHYGGLHQELAWHSDWFLNLMLAFDTGVVYVPENFSICRLEGKKSYSSNRFHWPSEKIVIRESILNLRQYPEHAELFKRSALLPKFDIRSLPMFLLDKELRWFLTPLLVWRMLMRTLTAYSKNVIPRPILTFFRPYLRL